MMTSSPGSRSARIAAISSAAVHEWVSKALEAPVRASSQREHWRVKFPSPARWPLAWAWAMYQSSLPVMWGLLKGMFMLRPGRVRVRNGIRTEDPKLLQKKQQDREHDDRHALDELMGMAHAVDQHHQRDQVEQVTRCVGETVAHERRPVHPAVSEGPALVEDEGLHHPEQIEHAHGELGPDACRRQREISQVEHHVRCQPHRRVADELAQGGLRAHASRTLWKVIEGAGKLKPRRA